MSKVTVRANHTVRVCITPGKPGDKAKGIAPTAPVVKEYTKGTLFNLDKDEADNLVKMGAVDITGEAPVAAAAAAPTSTRAKPGPKPKKAEAPAAPENPATAVPAPEAEEGEGEGDGDGSDAI